MLKFKRKFRCLKVNLQALQLGSRFIQHHVYVCRQDIVSKVTKFRFHTMSISSTIRTTIKFQRRNPFLWVSFFRYNTKQNYSGLIFSKKSLHFILSTILTNHYIFFLVTNCVTRVKVIPSYMYSEISDSSVFLYKNVPRIFKRKETFSLWPTQHCTVWEIRQAGNYFSRLRTFFQAHK